MEHFLLWQTRVTRYAREEQMSCCTSFIPLHYSSVFCTCGGLIDLLYYFVSFCSVFLGSSIIYPTPPPPAPTPVWRFFRVCFITNKLCCISCVRICFFFSRSSSVMSSSHASGASDFGTLTRQPPATLRLRGSISGGELATFFWHSCVFVAFLHCT